MPRKSRRSSGRKYGKKAQREVRTEMRHMKSGKHPVKNHKQADRYRPVEGTAQGH